MFAPQLVPGRVVVGRILTLTNVCGGSLNLRRRKSGNATNRRQRIRLLASVLAMCLVIVSLDGCRKSQGKQARPPASTTSAPRDTAPIQALATKGTAPIQVLVTRDTTQAGRVEYRYSVINRSAPPIYLLMIGWDERNPQLAGYPIGWDGDTIPRTSYRAPSGWEFEIQTVEEESLVSIQWIKTSQGKAIMKGDLLEGFAVFLPGPDPEYGRGGLWSAYVYGELPMGGAIIERSGSSR